MSLQDNFKKTLTDFFSLYHPRQIKKVDDIVKEFNGKEIEVFNHLCAKYKVAKSKVPGLIDAEEKRKEAAKIATEAPNNEEPKVEVIEENTSSDEVEEINDEVEEVAAGANAEVEDEFGDEDENKAKKKKKKKK